MVGRADEQAATLPGARDLSLHGQLLRRSLEARMFGDSGASGVTRLGRYHLLETLGRGAMGVVFKAYDPQLDRKVAIKVVTLASTDARARMLREAKALAKLNHPNVVTVHEVGEDADEMFVAMEYVEGGTLADWCDAHPAPSRERSQALLELMLQALDGLAAAHDLGLVHRDLKPANLLVGSDGRLRVADFGLAMAFEGDPEQLSTTLADLEGPDASALTQTGSIVGTPAFMAPEQFRGQADTTSDLFGLCASFFVALHGRQPYEAASLVGLLDALDHGRLVAPTTKHVPGYLCQALQRGLRPRPSDRFPDAQAMSRVLRAGASRRRWTAGVSMASVGAAAIAAVVWASQPSPCSDERERITSLTLAESDRIAAAVEASGMAHAGEVTERFSTALDRTADHWSTQRLDACIASRSPEPAVATVGQRRLRCLDDALATTEQTLSGLTSFTPREANTLPMVGQFLRGVADCEQLDAETFDSAFGRRTLATFRAGLLAEERLETDEAQAAYHAVLDTTRAGQLPEIRAQAHWRLGNLADRTGDDETMHRHFLASLDEAAQGDDGGLEALGWLCAAKTLPPTDSDASFDLLVERSHRARREGPLTEERQAELLYEEAFARYLRGQVERSESLAREALSIAEPADTSVLPFIHRLLTALLQQRGDLEQAEAHAVAAVSVVERRKGPHHPDLAGMLLLVANLRSWRDDDAQAIATYDRIIGTLEDYGEDYGPQLNLAYLGRGDNHLNLFHYDDALADYDRAAVLTRGMGEAGETQLDRIYSSRARIHWVQHRYEAALAELELAAKLGEPSTPQSLEARASGFILQARILTNLERHDTALALLETHMPMIERAFPPDGVARVQTAIELADVYTNAAQPDLARAELERALPKTDNNPLQRSKLQQAMARSFHAEGSKSDARHWATLARESMERAGGSPVEQDVLDDLFAMLER